MIFSTKNLLTTKNIFDRITSYQIFRAYVRSFIKVGESFSSEFRPDKAPSCRIEFIGGDLLYTDFGEGSYRAVSFMQRKFGLSYIDCLRKLNVDFGLRLLDKGVKPLKSKIVVVKPLSSTPKNKLPTIIKIKSTDFNVKDLEYWGSYGWTLDMLKRANIKAIDFYWLTMLHKGISDKITCTQKELAYSFDFYKHKGILRRKLYFPERFNRSRFLSNVDHTIVQGWPELPRNGNILFIPSSMKDRGPFVRLRYPGIAPNTEGTFIPEAVFYKLKPRFKRIILYYDNDSTGIYNALRFAKKYQIEAIWNPLRAPKDPSDYVASYNNPDVGLREFNYYLNSQL